MKIIGSFPLRGNVNDDIERETNLNWINGWAWMSLQDMGKDMEDEISIFL